MDFFNTNSTETGFFKDPDGKKKINNPSLIELIVFFKGLTHFYRHFNEQNRNTVFFLIKIAHLTYYKLKSILKGRLYAFEIISIRYFINQGLYSQSRESWV
jgi:hypothetical protein